ncbi:hypothetical protein PZH32_10210 [Adlercreutzia equolifaciens]|uniref:hypothetical protein n=1 Tax=Adlercreutzia equolifaciens TaxID=446660 RepID=UPI0023B1A0A8|nr:hypothetical protein [Adlercreutzia equolifaciens]MDE8703330.1 hypothetical protein [Adlercreutzia equolifaciens]
MAKKDLRAQMDAARAAAAFIGAAQESALQEEAAHPKRQGETAAAEEVKGEPPLEGAAEVPDYFTLEDALNASSMTTAARSSEIKRSASAVAEGEEGAKRGKTSVAPIQSESRAAVSATTPNAASASSGSTEVSAASAAKPATASAIPDILPDHLAAPTASADLIVEEEAPRPAPAAPKASKTAKTAEKPKAPRAKRGRKKAQPAEAAAEAETAGNRMTAQVLVPMTAEQREHADLLAQVMKITRAEVMRQALDEYWENHRSELQAAVAAYEALIRKLMS